MKTAPPRRRRRRRELRRDACIVRAIAVAILTGGLLAANIVPGVAATLEPAESVSNEGFYQLTWEAQQPVRLVESTNPEFAAAETIYTGSDSGHVVSGKPNGTWYYRLESADGAAILSEVSAITVSHHSLARAFAFFSVGAVVFAATLGLIFLTRPDDDERA